MYRLATKRTEKTYHFIVNNIHTCVLLCNERNITFAANLPSLH